MLSTRLARSLAAAAALCVAGLPARAQVIGFSVADSITTGMAYHTPTTFSRGAYAIDYDPSVGGFGLVGSPADCLPKCTSNGRYNFYAFAIGTLSLSGGPATGFTLTSIEAAQAFTAQQTAFGLTVVGSLVGGGMVSTQFSAAPGTADVFQTFVLPSSFTGLQRVSVSALGTFPYRSFALSNFTVEASVLATPEPATLALVAGGLAVIGVAARRRRTA